MDKGAWRATVHGVAKSGTQLSTHTPPGILHIQFIIKKKKVSPQKKKKKKKNRGVPKIHKKTNKNDSIGIRSVSILQNSQMN